MLSWLEVENEVDVGVERRPPGPGSGGGRSEGQNCASRGHVADDMGLAATDVGRVCEHQVFTTPS